MIVDSAIYVNGRRPVEPASLQEVYEARSKHHRLVWSGLYEPTEEEEEEEFSFVARRSLDYSPAGGRGRDQGAASPQP